MPLDPRVAKILFTLLVAVGALMVMSATVNIIGAVRLLEPSDEAALGMTRNFVIAQYALMLLGGLAMVVFGLRGRK